MGGGHQEKRGQIGVYNKSEHALDVCVRVALTGPSGTLPLVSVPTATLTTHPCLIVVFLTNFKV